MSDVLILEFDGATAKHYESVNKLLGIDMDAGQGDWPPGLMSHTGAADAAGNLIVFEVWDSQDSQAKFMDSRLGPSLAKAEVPAPRRSEWLALLAHHEL
jgi:hypothetical protein